MSVLWKGYEMNEFAQLVSMPVICVWGVIVFWGLVLLSIPFRMIIQRGADAQEDKRVKAMNELAAHYQNAPGVRNSKAEWAAYEQKKKRLQDKLKDAGGYTSVN